MNEGYGELITDYTANNNDAIISGTLWSQGVSFMQVSVEEQPSFNSPDKYFFFNTYPNPFSQLSTINYILKKRSNLVIKIYDILGNEIKYLINNFQDKGEKSVIWDGKDKYNNPVKPGNYFIVIQVDGKTQSQLVTKID